MNPILGYLIQRPGLLAGMLPVLVLACIGAVQYWRQGRRMEASRSEWETIAPEESGQPPLTDSLPYYRLNESEETLSIAKRSGGILSQIGFRVADYFITHFALVSVLGAVAFGGIAVTSFLSGMKFVNVWTVAGGVALFLVYLAFVGIVIVVVNRVSEQALWRLGKNKE